MTRETPEDLAAVLGSTEAQAATAWAVLQALDRILESARIAHRAFEAGLWSRDAALAGEAGAALAAIARGLREIREAGEGRGPVTPPVTPRQPPDTRCTGVGPQDEHHGGKHERAHTGRGEFVAAPAQHKSGQRNNARTVRT